MLRTSRELPIGLQVQNSISRKLRGIREAMLRTSRELPIELQARGSISRNLRGIREAMLRTSRELPIGSLINWFRNDCCNDPLSSAMIPQ